ncbi:DMT family transporter [Streptomyces sp. NPDC018059]|uniref:DMT family transporter n=1 Tax=Streptomyces sp. NPDC018059 TaxID=3365041 RepID=UPI0037B03E94
MSAIASPEPPAAPTTGGESPTARGTRARGWSTVDWRIRSGAVALIWGFCFLLIKLGTNGYAPPYVSFGRMLLGTVVLAGTLTVKRERLPRTVRIWGHLAIAGFLLNAFPFTVLAYSQLTISSTLAGICSATIPLWGMALSLVTLSDDRPTRRRFGGLAIGFIGVLTVLRVWQGFSAQDAPGIAMALAGAASYAAGWSHVRRALAGTGSSHLSLTVGQMLLGTAQVAVIAPVLSPLPTSFPVVPALAITILGVLGTGFVTLIQYGLVVEVGPTVAAVNTYFIPVVAIFAGVTFLGERLTWNTPVGTVIVLAGAALAQPGQRSRPAESNH